MLWLIKVKCARVCRFGWPTGIRQWLLLQCAYIIPIKLSLINFDVCIRYALDSVGSLARLSFPLSFGYGNEPAIIACLHCASLHLDCKRILCLRQKAFDLIETEDAHSILCSRNETWLRLLSLVHYVGFAFFQAHVLGQQSK